MTSPAAICRQLEERERVRPRIGRVDFGHAAVLERRRMARGSIPLRPTEVTVKLAEREAAEAAHALEMADPDIGSEHLDYLRRRAGETRARARRLREAMEAEAPARGSAA